MVHYSKDLAKMKTLEFCRYPIPRSATEIARHLRDTVPGFYPKTPDKKVSRFVQDDVLADLVAKNILVKYTPDTRRVGVSMSMGDTGSAGGDWAKIRALMRIHHANQDLTLPRNLTALYQVNFLYLDDAFFMYNLPVLQEHNFDLITLFYPLVRDRKLTDFLWHAINLFMCYTDPAYRHVLQLEMRSLDFSDREQTLIDATLEFYPEFRSFFERFPFKPNIETAKEFLALL